MQMHIFHVELLILMRFLHLYEAQRHESVPLYI